MDRQSLARLFHMNYDVLLRNVEGLGHEDSILQPTPAGNCLNWVVGHVVSTRNDVLALLGAAPVMAGRNASRYARGSKPVTGPADAAPFLDLLADLGRSQERLSEALGQASGTLSREAVDALEIFHFHEAYHVGQTGLLRRLAGREGVIR